MDDEQRAALRGWLDCVRETGGCGTCYGDLIRNVPDAHARAQAALDPLRLMMHDCGPDHDESMPASNCLLRCDAEAVWHALGSPDLQTDGAPYNWQWPDLDDYDPHRPERRETFVKTGKTADFVLSHEIPERIHRGRTYPRTPAPAARRAQPNRTAI